MDSSGSPVQAPAWGLALSGGGVCGAAHLGVLKAFDEWGLHPASIVGASAGGLVAGAIASGVTLADLTAFFAEVSRDPWAWGLTEAEHIVMDLWPRPAPGAMTMAPVIDRLLRLHAPEQNRTVACWPGEYAVLATDFGSETTLVIDNKLQVPGRGRAPAGPMPVEDALQATSAFPLLFSGVRYTSPTGDILLQDGGLLDNVPAAICFNDGCSRVLAVDVGNDSPDPLPPALSLGGLLQRMAGLVVSRLTAYANAAPRGPVYRLAPVLPPGSSLLSFPLYADIVQSGYEAAVAQKDRILSFVQGGG